MAEESLLQVDPDPAWYEELMRLKEQGRVSMTPAKGLLRSNVATGVAQELANPPELNWKEAEYLELQKNRGKNLDRYLRFDFEKMQPGTEFTKASRYLLDPALPKLEERMKKSGHWGSLPEGARKEFSERVNRAKTTPLRLFHGSPEAWTSDSIDPKRLQERDRGYFGSGFYMSPNFGYANKYKTIKGKGESANVMQVYANIQRPFNFSKLTNADLDKIDKVLKDHGHRGVADITRKSLTRKPRKSGSYGYTDYVSDEEVVQHLENWASSIPSNEKGERGDISMLLKLAGYDSSIADDANEVIIFDPKQAKGIFNQGSFNPLVDDLQSNLGLGSNYARRA